MVDVKCGMSDFFRRDVAQPGSAFAWGARGRWFESSRPDEETYRKVGLFLFHMIFYCDKSIYCLINP